MAGRIPRAGRNRESARRSIVILIREDQDR